MAEINKDKVGLALKVVHASDRDYFSHDDLLALLSKLSQEPYDTDIFE